jgi:hypothetical protein
VPVYLLGCDAFVERGPKLIPLRDGWSIEVQEAEPLETFRQRALVECRKFASQIRFDDDCIWFVPVIVDLLPSQLSSKFLI